MVPSGYTSLSDASNIWRRRTSSDDVPRDRFFRKTEKDVGWAVAADVVVSGVDVIGRQAPPDSMYPVLQLPTCPSDQPPPLKTQVALPPEPDSLYPALQLAAPQVGKELYEAVLDSAVHKLVH